MKRKKKCKMKNVKKTKSTTKKKMQNGKKAGN